MRNLSEAKHLEPIITVDVVIFTIEDGVLKVLVIRRQKEPFKGLYALPGGFINPKETLHAAAERVLLERAGVDWAYVEQLSAFDGSGKDPRGNIPTVAYYALVAREHIVFEAAQRGVEAVLLPVAALPPLAFQHTSIVQYAVTRLRYKLQYTNAAYALLAKRFTFGELQNLYEIIFGKNLDKRNFKKKFISLGLIRSTRQLRSGGRHRPARLYEFIERKPQDLKRFF